MKNLIYYYWPQCYYCQKVTICLEEKKLSHEDKVINLMRYENFNPEFVDKNPLCLVPVIEDSSNTVNESDNIIDYLEKYEPKLYPERSNSKGGNDVHKIKELISNLPVSQIHFGCLSPNYKRHIKMDIEFVDKYTSIVKGKAEYLKNMAVKYPKFKDIYEKKSLIAQNLDIDKIGEGMDKNLYDMRKGLELIEEQLKVMESENKDWICSNTFSVADIYLCVLLHKMDTLGLAQHLWDGPSKPLVHLSKYFERGMSRPSVQIMIPQYKLGAPGAD